MANIIQSKPTGGVIMPSGPTVKLGSGVTIDKKSYISMDKEARKTLDEKGAEGYKELLISRATEKATADYIKEHYVQLGDGQYIDKKAFQELDTETQNILREKGIAGYEEKVKENYETAIGGKAVVLDSGELVPESFYESLPADGKHALMSGVQTYLTWAEKQGQKQPSIWNNYTNVTGPYYVSNDVWNKLSDSQKDYVKNKFGGNVKVGETLTYEGHTYTGIESLSANEQTMIKNYHEKGGTLPQRLIEKLQVINDFAPADTIVENLLRNAVIIKTQKDEAVDYKAFRQLDKKQQEKVVKHGIDSIKSDPYEDLVNKFQQLMDKSTSGGLPDGTIFTSPNGVYEYMVFSDTWNTTGVIPKELSDAGWEKVEDNLLRRKTGADYPDVVVTKSFSPGLEVPEGWERVPGYPTLIRLIASIADTPIDLSDTDIQTINSDLTTTLTSVEQQIAVLNAQINALFGKDGDGWYSAPAYMVKNPDDVAKAQELMDKRAALLYQYRTLTAYLGDVKRGEASAAYTRYVDAISSPEMIPYINADGTIDIFGAIKDDKVSDDTLKAALNMTSTNFAYFQELEPYVRDDGSINIIGAMKDGKVRDTSIIRVLGVTQKQYNDFKTIARYTDDAGDINLASMYADNMSYETMHELIGISQSDYKNITTWLDSMKEDDPEGYKIYLNKGYAAYQRYFESNNTELPDGSWIPNTAIANIEETDPEGYKILIEKGYKEYQTYFKDNNTEVSENIWIPNTVLHDIETNDPDGWKVYKDKGWDAYQTYFKDNNTEVSENIWIPNTALHDIETNDPEGWKIYKDKGWDAYQTYFKDNNTEVSENIWIPNTVLHDIETNDPDGWKVYKDKGWDAYQDYFDKTYTKLPDGQYINKNYIDAMNNPNSDSYNPDAYQLLTTKGYDAYMDVYDKTIDWLKSVGAVIIDDKGNESYDLQAAIEKSLTVPGREWQDNMKLIFGKDYELADRLYNATHVTMSAYGSTPVMMDQEYAEIMKPEDISQAEYDKMVPFIKTSGIDIEAAINAKVPESTILKVTGITNEELDEYKWLARYNSNGDWGKLGMTIARDPKTLFAVAKEAGVGMIPIYGTAHYWENMNAGWKVASVVGEILFFAPVVKGISVAVKTGQSISEAALKGLTLASRDAIIAPYNILRHPVQTAKTMSAPIESLLNTKALPLAITYRGSYSKNMDITKVLAGMTEDEAMRTRKAMEELIRRVTAGEKNVKIPIEGIGTLRYKGSGLTEIMPDWAGTSTPFGEAFKNLGVDVKGEGLFMSPEHYLGLSFQTATGKAPLYVYKGSELLGVIDETGHCINNSGKTIGRIAEGTKIIGLDNKTLGILNKDFKVVNNANEIVGYYKEGAIVTDNAALIGKYYNGQPYTEKGKIIGYINEAGEIVDESGKVISTMAGKERVIGIVPESAKIVNDAGKVIGRGKAAPAFAMVYTKGVQELPEWVQKAGSMAEMEKRAWELFKTGKYGNDLYPVFKQYANWIELEGLLPPGTKLIPLVGGNGKPIVMFTRDPAGRKIEIPLMQVVDKDWFKKSMELTKEIQAADVIPDPMPLASALKSVKNIPSKAVKPLLTWLKSNKEAHIIGSFSETVFTKGKIKANDIDIAVPNPEKVIDELTDILKTSGRQVRNDGKSVIEVYNDKKGIWEKAIDVDPLEWAKSNGLKTTNIEGVNVQTPASQVSNLLKRMTDNFEGKGYSRFVRYVNALGKDVDLGIGAKPPKFKDVAKLKAYGVYNTVRDIFVKGLTKETALRVNAMAPDLAPQTKALLQRQQRLIAEQESYRRAVASASKTGRTPSLKSKEKEIEKLSQDVEEMRTSLEEKIVARAQILEPITRRISGSSKKDERLYNEIINRTSYAITRSLGRKPTSPRIKPKTDDVGTYTARALTPAPRAVVAETVRESSRSKTDTDTARASRGARRDIISRTGRAVASSRAESTRGSRKVADMATRSARKVTSREDRIVRTSPKTKKLPQPYEYYDYKAYEPKYINANRITTIKDKDIKKDKKKKPSGKGEISWRQGAFWITLHPRVGGGYVTAYSKEPPEGYKQRKRLPNETFFTRGDSSTIPPEIKMQMGIVNAKITPTGEVKLKYKRKK